MGYWFNVRVEKDNREFEYKFIPDEFKDNNKEKDLADYDYYTLEHRKDLKDIISKELGVDVNKIGKVTIDYRRNDATRDNNPYSLILGNIEMEKLLEKENGKFKHLTMGRRDFYNKGKTDIRVIYAVDPILLKMRSYIFSDMDKFSREIYNSDGEMGKILKNYNAVIKSHSDNSYVERKFYDQFTEYKSFRSLSMAKYRYERKPYHPDFNKNNSDTTAIKKDIPVKNNVIGTSTTTKETDYYNRGLENFNQENEEFLEPEEFDQMINYDSSKEKRI